MVGRRGSITWDSFNNLRAGVPTGLRNGLLDAVLTVPMSPLDLWDRVGQFGAMGDVLNTASSR